LAITILTTIFNFIENRSVFLLALGNQMFLNQTAEPVHICADELLYQFKYQSATRYKGFWGFGVLGYEDLYGER